MAQDTAMSSGTTEDARRRSDHQYDQMAAQVESVAKAVAERGREVGDDVQAVAGNVRSAIDTSLRDQPMTTLALAAVVGFVMGALWKS